MPGRVNNVLVSNTGDAYTGMENTAAAARQLRALSLNEAALTELVALLREPDVLAAIQAGAADSASSTEESTPDSEALVTFLAYFSAGEGWVDLAERTPVLVEELEGTGISQELRLLLAQPDMQSWLRGLPLSSETGDQLDEILGRISDMEVLDVLSKNTVVAAAEIGGSVFRGQHHSRGALHLGGALERPLHLLQQGAPSPDIEVIMIYLRVVQRVLRWEVRINHN